MTTDNYSASTSLTAYYPSRTLRSVARHWSTEKLVHDLSALGLLNFFEGTASNPMSLSGASTAKLWLDTQSGVTASPGTFKRYVGGDATQSANWTAVTPGAYLTHLGGLSPVTDTEYFATKAAVQAASISGSATFIQVAGYTTAGDRGGGLYKKAASEPTHALKIQSTDGAWWELVPVNGIFAHQAGCVGDGTTDDTDEIEALFLAGVALQAPVRFPSGIYQVATQALVTITDDLQIIMDAGAVIRGSSGVSSAVVKVDGSTSRPRFTLTGAGEINNASRAYVPATASGTGLEILRCSAVNIDGIHFNAGDDYTANVGDSGIAAQECGTGRVTNCIFTGQPDLGIYVTGGGTTATTDDYSDWVIANNTYRSCSIAAGARRQINRVSFIGNVVEDCRQGFQTAEATSGATIVPPAREVIVAHNHFVRTLTRPVELRWAQEGSIVSDNVIIDACSDGGTAWAAISLLGCRGVAVTGNTIAFRDHTPNAAAKAFNCSNYTVDGTAKQSNYNLFASNTVRDMPVGISDSSTGPHYIFDNTYVNVATFSSGSGTHIVRHPTSSGQGVGTGSPSVPWHVVGAIRSQRSGETAQYVDIKSTATAGFVESYSDPANAKVLHINATTDGSHSATSGGTLALSLRVRNAENLYTDDAGAVYVPRIGTTASAANVFVDNASTPANQLLRVTSSLKYKTDVRDIRTSDALAIIEALRPITYRSRAEADDPLKEWLGLIAEEVATVDRRLVHWRGGEPDGVMYERLGVVLLSAVKDLMARVERLEAGAAEPLFPGS